MVYEAPTMVDYIVDHDTRLADLEKSDTYIATGESESAASESGLVVNNLAYAITFYVNASGQSRAQIVWTWDQAADQTADPDKLDKDLVVDYYFQLGVQGYQSTHKTTSITVTGIQPNTSAVGSVYAVTARGKRGPVATVTAPVGSDSAVPPQASTPSLLGAQGGVRGQWDGKDSAGSAMPAHTQAVQVHRIYGTDTAFTPSELTYWTTVRENETFYIAAESDNGPITVRFLAISVAGVVSATPSLGVTVDPLKSVADLSGVVLPGTAAYSNVGNVLVDGSFESDTINTLRTSLPSVGTWDIITDAGLANHGVHSFRVTSGTGTLSKQLLLSTITDLGSQLSPISVRPLEKYYVSFWFKATNGSTATPYLEFLVIDAAGNVTTDSASPSVSELDSWILHEHVYEVPEGAAYLALALKISNHSAGYVYIDSVAMRLILGTQLIEDAAITNAKIGDAEITSAKIQSVDAGTITTGLLIPDVIDAGSITADKIAIGSVGTNQLEPTIGTDLDLSGNADVVNKADIDIVNNISDNVISLNDDMSAVKNSIVIDGSGITITKAGSNFSIRIDNDSLDFLNAGNVIAQMTGLDMFIKAATIGETLQVGVHIIEKYDAENTFIRWVG